MFQLPPLPQFDKNKTRRILTPDVSNQAAGRKPMGVVVYLDERRPPRPSANEVVPYREPLARSEPTPEFLAQLLRNAGLPASFLQIKGRDFVFSSYYKSDLYHGSIIGVEVKEENGEKILRLSTTIIKNPRSQRMRLFSYSRPGEWITDGDPHPIWGELILC